MGWQVSKQQLLVCNCLEVNTMQGDGEQEEMKRGGRQREQY